jgi:hypothetical protein
LKLPRSPTWRSSSVGAPWVLLWGLTGGVSEGRSVHIHVLCDTGSWRIGREWGSGRGAKGAGRGKNIQCGPALVQPLVLSPNAWTWIPRSAFGSLPEMLRVMVVGSFSELCSKVTEPLTFESPRMTATVVHLC